MHLGIDIGTTSVKAIIADGPEVIVAQASADHPTTHPQTGWNEQNPDGWLNAVKTAVNALEPELRSGVSAIGLSGQMHSMALLGADRKPLRPAILWNDARCEAEARALADEVPDIGRITGVIPMAGFTAAKLVWVRAHEPDVFRRIDQVMLAKDYVRLWLTGDCATDVSDGAGMQLLDEAARDWSPVMLEAVGLKTTQVPRLFEGNAVTGNLSAGCAAELGLPGGIPVAAGGGDAATSAVALGAVSQGEGFISLGTAAVYAVVQETYSPKPDLMLHSFAHSLPGRWYQMAGMLNGASALAWAAELVGETDVGAALKVVEDRYSGPSSVTFLPYLTGERTPHNNPKAKGVFFGLDPTTNKYDLLQSAIEGVAYSFRLADDCIAEAGVVCERPGLVGGGAQSELWGRIIATLLGRPMARYDGVTEAAALGAARLAMMATGMEQAEATAPPRDQHLLEPLPHADAYEAGYQTFRQLYKSVEAHF